MAAASRNTVAENSVTVFMRPRDLPGNRARVVSKRRRPYGRALLLGDHGLELLVVVVRMLGQRVGVEVLVAAVAGESLFTLRLGLLDHVLHELLRLGNAALDASLGRRRRAL